MSNFDFLIKQKCFSSFANLAVNAEALASVMPDVSIIQSRKTAECATKWLYSVDNYLSNHQPQDTSFKSLLANYHFRNTVGSKISDLLYQIRTLGNKAAHGEEIPNVNKVAPIVVGFLFYFLDWIDQNYGAGPAFRRFDLSILRQSSLVLDTNNESEAQIKTDVNKDDVPSIEQIAQETVSEKDELNKKKETNKGSFNPSSSDISEKDTRKLLIDVKLDIAGWKKGENWLEEYHVEGMPNTTGDGYIDYILLDDDGIPLAVVEAKRTSVSVENGRKQARIYAELIEKKFGYKPVIFLTNGYETRILNDDYPERVVSAFYSKKDLQSVRFKRSYAIPLDNIDTSELTNRYYQKEAIVATCEHFSQRFRKALLVMATGSGKTRTIFSIIKVLAQHNWVKNVLFLADRYDLVRQAYGEAKIHLKSFPIANLCAEKKEDRNINARIVFSTYQTMIGTIDLAKDEDGNRIFSPGHFDLLVCDEAHRSIYNRYKEIFDYFDSLLIGLTATPKDEIDKNTYKIFNLESGNPTYYYGLKQAVEDKFLVNYETLEIKTKFINDGIKYDELSDEDKEAFDETFGEDSEWLDKKIPSAAINKWIFNKDTVRQILETLFSEGIKIECGDKIGKTIIFARNHAHAEFIKSVFEEEYPYLGDEFCTVIDNKIKFSSLLIDDFKDPKKKPQIAVSVDMLDTGVDIPECLNLVFFKPVFSKAKFWQMIGRGTRLCPNLIDGKDKDHFLIIDACNNFSFFGENPEGYESKIQVPLEQRIFANKMMLLSTLQHTPTIESADFQNVLIDELHQNVTQISKDSFSALKHTKAICKYSNKDNFLNLDKDGAEECINELGRLIVPEKDDFQSRRFDCLMYSIELKYTEGKLSNQLINKLRQYVVGLQDVGDTFKEVKKHEALLNRLLDDDFVKGLTLNDWEDVRQKLRDLIKFIQSSNIKPIIVDFTDEVVSEEFDTTGVPDELVSFESYKNRLERYVKEHLNEGVISKIHNNQKLEEKDLKELEDIVWHKLGSKQEYEESYNDKDVGILIRSIAGLDKKAAKELFAKFIDEHNLSLEQMHFINTVVDYVVANGYISVNTFITDSTFEPYDLTDLFKTEDMLNFVGLIKTFSNQAALHL